MGHLRGFRKTADNAGQPAWRPVHRSQNRLAQVRPAIAVSAVDDEQAHTGNLGKTRRHDGAANQACRPGSGDIQKPSAVVSPYVGGYQPNSSGRMGFSERLRTLALERSFSG